MPCLVTSFFSSFCFVSFFHLVVYALRVYVVYIFLSLPYDDYIGEIKIINNAIFSRY